MGRPFPPARIGGRLPGLVVGLLLQLFPPVFAGCLELSGSGFVGSGMFRLVSWPVGVFLRMGEGFIRLVRFIASTVTEIGKNKITAFYLGTGLF